ncbi:MAG: hypothetical protein ACREA0_31325, partial [bacterium]
MLEPANGVVVRPGSSVLFRFQVDPASQVTTVRTLSFGTSPRTNILEATAPAFQAQLTIPSDASGPIQLMVIGVTNQEEADIVRGPDLVLNVVPEEALESLEVTSSLALVAN